MVRKCLTDINSRKLDSEFRYFKRFFSCIRPDDVFITVKHYSFGYALTWESYRFEYSFYSDIINVLSFANFLADEYNVELEDIEVGVDIDRERLKIFLYHVDLSRLPIELRNELDEEEHGLLEGDDDGY